MVKWIADEYLNSTMRYLVVVVFTLSCVFKSQGQSDYRFAHLGTKEGLISDQAYCLFEDVNGFIWIGTAAGLQRYDGDELVDFPLSEGGSDAVFVRDIIGQGQDTIWIAIRGGGVRSIVNNRVNEAITTEQGLSSNLAECLMIDQEGTLWVGTMDAGINAISNGKIDPNHRLAVYSEEMKHAETYALMEDLQGNIWEGTTQGINFYHVGGGMTLFENDPNNSGSLSHDYAHEIHQDRSGKIWIGTVDGGLNLFNAEDSTFTSFEYQSGFVNQITHNVILAIEDNQSEDGLWIGTWGGGLNAFDGITFESQFDRQATSALKSNRIEDIMIDSHGDLWIATFQGGISKYYQQTFVTYSTQENAEKGMRQSTITHLSPSASGGVWIATNDGVNHFINGEFQTYTVVSGHLKFNDINKIVEDRHGGLWMGMIGTGRGLLHLQDGKSSHFFHVENDSLSISSDFVESLLEDSQGRLWIGTRDGLNLYDKGQFIRFKEDPQNNSIPSNQIRGISESVKGGIWIATYGGGLSYYEDGVFTNFYDPQTMPYEFIWNAVEHPNQVDLWMALSGNVLKFNLQTGESRLYSERDGLISQLVDDLVIDEDGRVWVATSKGLCLYLPEVDKFKTFTNEDGMAGDRIQAITLNENKLYAGGEAGFATLDLDRFRVDDTNHLTFTRFESLDIQELPQNEPTWTTITDQIEVPYDQNSFNIYFSSMKLGIDDDPQYAYRANPLHKDWIYKGSSNQISFIDLAPGKYQLQVKELGAEHIIEMAIVVRPPYWNTSMAHVIYFILLVSMSIGIASFIRKRKKLRDELERSEYYRAKDHELNQTKLRFFTNVSHELRTPLTLILGPIQDLIERKVAPSHLDKLTFIRDNSVKLLQLTNQLLDFRKISVDRMQLLCRQSDIISFSRNCFQSFQFKASHENVTYLFRSNHEELSLHFDSSKIETVLMNLLSNAFKFQNGYVALELHAVGNPSKEGEFKEGKLIDNYLKIQVIDNGDGLSPQHSSRVFDRFYQAQQKDSLNSSGTGIGLALAKDLIELHHGDVSVESEPQVRTTFTVKLPFGSRHVEDHEMDDIQEPSLGRPTQQQESLIQENGTSKYSILLVEDHADLRSYLTSELSRHFQIRSVGNGQGALELLEHFVPDLILSDVMMEGMDGISLCRSVKSDPDRSHIPVILITARAMDEHELEGLEAGANDYIIKPFNLAALIKKIDNFIAIRQQLKDHYRGELHGEGPDFESEETIFISEIVKLIKTNMRLPGFGVGELSQLLGMSKSTLYKKVKFLIDKSVVELISEVRLKEASILVVQTDKRISEIGYELGFNDPKYFRNCFKKQYGSSPVEFRKQNQEEPIPKNPPVKT